jgi:hypothetical protein
MSFFLGLLTGGGAVGLASFVYTVIRDKSKDKREKTALAPDLVAELNASRFDEAGKSRITIRVRNVGGSAIKHSGLKWNRVSADPGFKVIEEGSAGALASVSEFTQVVLEYEFLRQFVVAVVAVVAALRTFNAPLAIGTAEMQYTDRNGAKAVFRRTLIWEIVNTEADISLATDEEVATLKSMEPASPFS